MMLNIFVIGNLLVLAGIAVAVAGLYWMVFTQRRVEDPRTHVVSDDSRGI